jgi:hypothetical protein
MSSTIEVTLAAMRREMRPLLETAMEGVLTKARGVLEEVERQRADGLAEVTEERAKGLAALDAERTSGLSEVDARRAELQREIAAMHKHKEEQAGRIELNIGGYRFETSVQTLRRLPHTFFDAYFSGRYAQEACSDGSIFVDRDGEHFGHVLEYMRDGMLSVAEAGALPSVSLLRALKREFGFYCIELVAEQPAEPILPEMAFVMGGTGFMYDDDSDDGEYGHLASMERYDALSGRWSAVAGMGTERTHAGVCAISGDIYISGGWDGRHQRFNSVEKYSISSDTWSTFTILPLSRSHHVAVTVGLTMYILGGLVLDANQVVTASVLKYDSAQGPHGTWSEVAPMPGARYGFTSCAVGMNIYVFGGSTLDYTGQYVSIYKYDTVANAWSILAQMPFFPGYECHSACLDGLIYIMGTMDGTQVKCFDPESGAWKTVSPTSYSHSGGASFVLGGSLYAAGGDASSASMERYDVTSDTWTAVSDMLQGRSSFSAVTVGSADMVEEDLFGTLIAKASGGYKSLA